MEHYSKGKNVEKILDRSKIPIENLPQEITWMQVRGGSKIRNLVSYALKNLCNDKPVLWTGFGSAVGKTVTCAEVMKRELKFSLHQITKINYYLVDEYWEPMIEELETIIVKRKLPMIHILLSLNPININDPSYQEPGLEVEVPEQKVGKRKRINSKRKQNEIKTK